MEARSHFWGGENVKFGLKAWYLFFMAALSLAFAAIGIRIVLANSLYQIDVLLMFYGIFAIVFAYFNASITYVSIETSGNELVLTDMLMRKTRIGVRQLLIGEVRYLWLSSGIVLRINEGRESKSISLMFYKDWRGMLTELEKATGVAIKNKEHFLHY